MNTPNYTSSRIAVPTCDGIEIYDCSEILRCEADKTTCFIYLADGSHILSTKSLKYFERILKAHDFMRIHKANMINIFHIRKYIKGKRSIVVLSDSSCVEVASRKKNQLLRVINAFPFHCSLENLEENYVAKSHPKPKKNRAVIAADRKTPETILIKKPKSAHVEIAR